MASDTKATLPAFWTRGAHAAVLHLLQCRGTMTTTEVCDALPHYAYGTLAEVLRRGVVDGYWQRIWPGGATEAQWSTSGAPKATPPDHMAMLRDLAARGLEPSVFHGNDRPDMEGDPPWTTLFWVDGESYAGGGHTPEAAIERAYDLAQEMEGQGDSR
jgi:hypothetical protein